MYLQPHNCRKMWKDCKAKPAKLEMQQLGSIGKQSQSQSVGVFGSGDGLRILSVASISRVNPCLFFFSDITWAAWSISSSMKTHLTGARNRRNHITKIQPKDPKGSFPANKCAFILFESFWIFLNRFNSSQWAASRDESKHTLF